MGFRPIRARAGFYLKYIVLNNNFFFSLLSKVFSQLYHRQYYICNDDEPFVPRANNIKALCNRNITRLMKRIIDKGITSEITMHITGKIDL